MEEIESILKPLIHQAKKLAFIGIGTEYRSDDGFGIRMVKDLIHELKLNRTQSRVILRESIEEGILVTPNLFLVCAGMNLDIFLPDVAEFQPDVVFIFDTAWFPNGQIGELTIVSPKNYNLSPVSTHTIPLSQISEFLGVYDQNPSILIIGIYPDTLEFGVKLSPKVANAQEVLHKFILSILNI